MDGFNFIKKKLSHARLSANFLCWRRVPFLRGRTVSMGLPAALLTNSFLLLHMFLLLLLLLHFLLLFLLLILLRSLLHLSISSSFFFSFFSPLLSLLRWRRVPSSRGRTVSRGLPAASVEFSLPCNTIFTQKLLNSHYLAILFLRRNYS